MEITLIYTQFDLEIFFSETSAPIESKLCSGLWIVSESTNIHPRWLPLLKINLLWSLFRIVSDANVSCKCRIINFSVKYVILKIFCCCQIWKLVILIGIIGKNGHSLLQTKTNRTIFNPPFSWKTGKIIKIRNIIINSGVDTIDTTTKLRSQTNQPKHIVAFCSKTINKPPY